MVEYSFMSFWKELPLPVVALSPMDGVTDQPFRHIQKKYGNPDVVYTEFTSVEGVCHGAMRLLEDFLYDETQRPIVAQIYGTTPQFFRETATILCELGFDGIDINMGCHAKNVAHSGAGAALIQTPSLAQEIIAETKAGVADYGQGLRARDCEHITEPIWKEVERRHQLLPKRYQERAAIPVSVKTRIGYGPKVVDEWIPTLMELEPAVIAVHGRTLKQHYGGRADWDAIAKGAEYTKGTDTLYFGNGDVLTYEQAIDKVETYGVDGVLIGRGAFGNPFCFWPPQQFEQETPPTIYEIALEHCQLYEQTYRHNHKYSFLPMRKHLGWYVKAIPDATTIRQKLFQTNNLQEVKAVFNEYGLI
jgi:tRNA-dihydrouridine synthase